MKKEWDVCEKCGGSECVSDSRAIFHKRPLLHYMCRECFDTFRREETLLHEDHKCARTWDKGGCLQLKCFVQFKRSSDNTYHDSMADIGTERITRTGAVPRPNSVRITKRPPNRVTRGVFKRHSQENRKRLNLALAAETNSLDRFKAIIDSIDLLSPEYRKKLLDNV